MDNSIFITDAREGPSFGKTRRMTERSTDALAPQALGVVWSHDGKTIACNRAVPQGDESFLQVFLLKLE